MTDVAVARAAYEGRAATTASLKALQKELTSANAARILGVCLPLIQETAHWELSVAHEEPLRPVVYASHALLSASSTTTDISAAFRYAID